ncbi:MAG: copper chaperone [Chitinophagaceae bacterium]|nr:copper chaperone [Chitinophagaceae bacterium]
MRAKSLLLLLLLVGGQQFCFAQFQSARLQATGLTCALCSKAIHESLQKLPFVAKVEADIQSSAFAILFRNGETQDPDALKAAVEEAGFFVGELLLEGQWGERP